MKQPNQYQIISLLLVLVIFVISAAAQTTNDALQEVSTTESRALSVAAVTEFEKARLRSEMTRAVENAAVQKAETSVVYQQMSRSSYNNSLADILYAGKYQYEVDAESHKIVQFGPRPRTIDDPEPVVVDFNQNFRLRQLRQMAYEFASQYSSFVLSDLRESVSNKEGLVYFFRWETDTKKFDGLPAFVQVGLTCGGDLISYTDTLELKETEVQTDFSNTNVQNVYAGVYIFANNGIDYTQYGPTRYWWTANNEGYCSTRIASWCNPKYMRYTYESWSPSNYAMWGHPGNAGGWGTHKVFIPRVHATTRWASYLITYQNSSSASFALDQLAYSDAWVQTRRLYAIANTWLSDKPFGWQSATGKKVGFDEIQILY